MHTPTQSGDGVGGGDFSSKLAAATIHARVVGVWIAAAVLALLLLYLGYLRMVRLSQRHRSRRRLPPAATRADTPQQQEPQQQPLLGKMTLEVPVPV